MAGAPGPPGRDASERACCGGRGITCGRCCCGARGAGAVGNGCRGPESTWPGRGAEGSGLAAGMLGRPGANTAAGGCGGLSILASLIFLNLLGQTTNVMTLGGLALAVGILVDDATVEIENTHRNMAMRKPLVRAVLDGAQQIAAPAFVSTLSICIVFVPVLLLTGAARYLFTPLAMAVVFAMLASYFLSRTLIPTMVHYMLRSEVELYAKGEHAEGGTGLIWRAHYIFNRRFELMRASYSSLLHWCLDHRLPVLGGFFLFVAGSLCLSPLVGRDFFPTVDSGAM